MGENVHIDEEFDLFRGVRNACDFCAGKQVVDAVPYVVFC
jgi:hypothetical protein